MKLYFFTILAALTAFVYAAAIESDPDYQAIARRVEDGDVVATALPDGRRRVSFYEEGIYQGYIIESADGAVQAFDAYDVEIALDDAEGDEGNLEKRGKLAIIKKFGKLLKKWGKKAWDFIYCVGFNSMLKCGDEYLECSKQGIPPWSVRCIEGHACVGGRAKDCIRK
ncbi:uncharacterized protein DNG_08173 [Cephalotrichum gorgonifer]|uniref:Uncharacterized protein n=1 Tax=Cephalotrichum gorgonifer TaxID=2041049 RepID=A0AAE8N2Z6_9PEZI|nr:uncharacterized protein DNG_08173 [Cephalotrichum gorgonifer]